SDPALADQHASDLRRRISGTRDLFCRPRLGAWHRRGGLRPGEYRVAAAAVASDLFAYDFYAGPIRPGDQCPAAAADGMDRRPIGRSIQDRWLLASLLGRVGHLDRHADLDGAGRRAALPGGHAARWADGQWALVACHSVCAGWGLWGR